ncbi:MAG: hypothetical protein ACOYMN_06940 [Roseimicrobium sp.]
MSAKVLIHARHTAKEVCDATSRAWPDLQFMLYRDQRGGIDEALLAPTERLRQPSATAVALEGTMTGREVSSAFQRAFGVLVEVIHAASGRSCMNVPLDRAR